ncbi:3-hydroxybutyryl-CoA dehydrogenase [Sporosarcina newyorkensis 2681]|uniref:L-gulonate 3-dehydrogenase n=1 Tax=Sporosarcina newyorkensis 2681 TaxID=1027292 RepID=F9DXH0_9BACL|nr:3-hydroxyacyl-CoA dehydrogenase family protein [Sporosarcina newyorkensis]EGQ20753.1 3-hydroxybutyryl-CoA dehydrogenase [Sporosarcina newyorkensis 2681]
MIQKVGIIGSGTMGFGIAFQFITNGMPVVLQDVKEESLELAKEKLQTYLTIFRDEGMPFKDSDEIIKSRLTCTVEIEDIADCDLVIESATENLKLKQKIFKHLDEICAEHTILTSNTSSLSMSDIIRDVEKHKGRVMLTHFFNPAHIVPLVELLKGPDMKQETYEEVDAFMKKMGKVTIEVRREVPGLVANRIQTALAREALSLLEDGVVSEEDLESAIFAGPGFRFASSGMLKIMDFGGLDVWDIVMEQLQPKIESDVRMFPIIKDKIDQGNLGVKSSKGFFKYPGMGLDEYVIERDRSLIQQLQTFNKREKAIDHA